jgi:hypothetical protein
MCSGAATRGGRQGLCPCTPLSGGKGWASALVLVLAYSLQCGWPYAGQAAKAGPLQSFLYWRTRYNVGGPTRARRQGLGLCTRSCTGVLATMWVALRGPGGRGWASAIVLVLAYSLQCGWPYAGQAAKAGPLHSFLYWRTRYNVGGPTRARRQGLCPWTPRGAPPLRTPKWRRPHELRPLSCLWSAASRHRSKVQSSPCATAMQLTRMQSTEASPHCGVGATAAKAGTRVRRSFQPLRHDNGRRLHGCFLWRGLGAGYPLGAPQRGCWGQAPDPGCGAERPRGRVKTRKPLAGVWGASAPAGSGCPLGLLALGRVQGGAPATHAVAGTAPVYEKGSRGQSPPGRVQGAAPATNQRRRRHAKPSAADHCWSRDRRL